LLSYCAKELEFIYKVKLVLWPLDSYALIFLVLIIRNVWKLSSVTFVQVMFLYWTCYFYRN